MYGRIVPGGKRLAAEREEIFGQTFLRVNLPLGGRPAAGGGGGETGWPAGFLFLRRVRRAAALLARSGVRRVLAPADFPYWPLLAWYGLLPVELTPLLHAFAAPLAVAALGALGVKPGRAVVRLSAARADRALYSAATELSAQVRRLVIDAPSGGNQLAAYLRREFGVAILERCDNPDLTVAFSPMPVQGPAPALLLYEPGAELLSLTLLPVRGELPQDCPPICVLSALWQTGRVGRDDLMVAAEWGDASAKGLDRPG